MLCENTCSLHLELVDKLLVVLSTEVKEDNLTVASCRTCKQPGRVEFWDSQASWTLPPTSAHHCKPQFFLRNSWVLGLLPTAKSNPFTRCELTLHHPKLHRCMCHGRTTRSSLDHRLVVNLHHAYVTKQSRYLLLRKNVVLERGLATRLAPADQSCWNIW